MKIICVDDERLLMESTVSMCLELPQIDEAKGFTRPAEALDWLNDNSADIALLDIDMPKMNGLVLAAEIKKKLPDIAIILLTGYSQFAVDAFELHALGYLLKPVTKEKLAENIAYALSIKPIRTRGHVFVQTFGNFDVFVDGELVLFKTARCKELLAYMVDKQGSSVTRAEVFAALWEDRLYDRPMQKQLDTLIRRMRDTLREYGIDRIFEMKNGTMRVNPDEFVCDAYLFFQGDPDSVNRFRGQYMDSYSWAAITESSMARMQFGNN